MTSPQTADAGETPPNEAMEIYQGHLDIVTEAFWARNFDNVRPHMLLPGTMRLKDVAREISDWDGRRALFDDQRDGLDAMGATEYHRLVVEAAFSTPDRIEGSHLSYVIRGGSLVVSPYLSRMPLVRTPAGWKAHGIDTDVSNADTFALGRRVERILKEKEQSLDTMRDCNAQT